MPEFFPIPALLDLAEEDLAYRIRPSGYYNIKAKEIEKSAVHDPGSLRRRSEPIIER